MKASSPRSTLLSRCTAIVLLLAVTLGAVRPAEADVPKWAWADVGAGLASAELGFLSVLVAGCASMSQAIRIHPPSRPDTSVVRNPRNRFDDMGALHNRIIDDYYRSYKIFDVSQYYAFLQKNHSRYGVEKLPDISVFEKTASTYANASDQEMTRRIDADLKAAGIKLDVVGQLHEIPGGLSMKELGDRVLRIENEALGMRDLNETQIRKLSVFFSILRYSLVYSSLKGGR